jgi:acetylornithine aminotransferase
MSSLIAAYARQPIAFEHGEGAWLWDDNGKQYLDGLGGIAVCALGHAHPAVTEAIRDQAGKLLHCSNIYRIPLQEQLGDKLCALAGMDKAFFSNSGAESNEAAIKLARLHASKRGVKNPTIVVMENSFHGRTLATLTATGSRKVQAGFEPLVQGFVRAPFGDLAALEQIGEYNRDVVAVLVEPIQGEGGITPASDDYLRGIRELCDRHGWLMMLDEIQTGMGRTGKWFAHQHAGIVPDVMSLAKALGNGYPIGAVLTRGIAAELIQPGNHGTTFGGNPMACRVGLSVIEAMENDGLVERAGELGSQLKAAFEAQLGDLDGVVEVRGRGCMLGIVLDRDCGELVAAGIEAGVLINVTAGRVVRLLPPYILSDEQADLLVERVVGIVRNFLGHSAGQAA